MQACLCPGRATYIGHILHLLPSSTIISSWKHIGFCSRNFGPPPSVEAAATLLVRSWNPTRSLPVPREEKKNPSRWVSELERYIPLELREDTKYDNFLEDKKSEPEQCLTILDILCHARTPDSLNYDLLAYIGVELGRWPAVYAIVNRLIDNAEVAGKSPSAMKRGALPSNIDWASLGSFDTMTGDECSKLRAPGILTAEGHISLDSIDGYNDGPQVTCRMGEKASRIGTMEEIWPALGSIVLQAADLPPEESRTAMFYFYRIVARLHHLDYIPHGVYKYTKSQVPEQLNRGTPAMHLLSSHIMNVLSDAVWIGHEIDKAVSALASGKKVSTTAKFRMKVRPLGPEIWLEFVLWCCVEGGFNVEGSWILEQLANRKPRWLVESFSNHSLPLDAINSSKIDRFDTWASCACGPKGASVNESQGPFVGLGKRTISSEVVTSMMDGLNNSVKVGVGHRGAYLTSIIEYKRSLIHLLRENNIYLKLRDVDHLIVRMMEARGVVPDVDPKSFELLLELSSDISCSLTKEPPKAVTNLHPLDRSAVVLGLKHYVLDAYTNMEHIYKARDRFAKLDAINRSKGGGYKSPYSVKYSKIPETKPLHVSGPNRVALQATCAIPHPNTASLTGFSSSSLSHLLDLSTSSKVHDFAHQLFFSHGEEFPTIPRQCYSDDLLAPAIIRYAAAIQNDDLLNTVAEDLPLPWSGPVIRAFFGYALQHHDWDRVNEILLHLRDNNGSGWDTKEVALLAAAIIRLDKNCHPGGQERTSGQNQLTPLARAEEILAKLLQGEFNPRPKYSEGHTQYHEGVLFQFLRLFKSIQGSISKICQNGNPQWKSKQLPTRTIPSSAFNEILYAVVETQGSKAGERLYRLWCIDEPPANIKLGGNIALRSTARTPENLRGVRQRHIAVQSDTGRYSKLVHPSLQTVRVIVRGMVRELYELEANGGNHHTGKHGALSKWDIFFWARNHFALFRVCREDVVSELDSYWEEAERELGMKRIEKESPSSSNGSGRKSVFEEFIPF
ncbi:hypothetical protein PAAG_01898 [Paracoccidioides lutzii Pb01]|uniref:Uncharacterized protein n=1 Tax=Paracoccidioides lutzii (strain ATCC MYA-826 / Pb01) TaxID=502779 RepID=C1GTQ3_PARBA|nr:hypothetical protein PAAG_01898 [Paracoccidioides lutzii Pb01]EEH39709.1 hypothetical protein PAAG_01898 [Paracoccidioides lutzii Pb01]